MRKTLLTCVAAVMAFAAFGAASAFAAAPPELVACVGSGSSNGSFEPQQVNTGTIPGAGLSLTEDACAILNPQADSDNATRAVTNLSTIKPPTQAPSQADLEALLQDVQNTDPSSPFAALALLSDACRDFQATDTCNTLIGTAVGTALGGAPIGQATLNGTSGYCFQGSQSGAGRVYGGGGPFLDLDWTADYTKGANAAGVLSGTASSVFGGGSYTIDGVIGPGCGAGTKALVMYIH